MMAKKDETAGAGGANGDGLTGSAVNAPTQAVLCGIMAWRRPEIPSTEQTTCLRVPRSAIETSEWLTAVSGQRLSGNPGYGEPRSLAATFGQEWWNRMTVRNVFGKEILT